MNSDYFFVRAGLNVRIIDDEAVIVDKESGDVHQLNSTASFIWQQFDGKTSTETIIDAVVEHFDVPAEVAERDVNAVISNFRDLNLLSE